MCTLYSELKECQDYSGKIGPQNFWVGIVDKFVFE